MSSAQAPGTAWLRARLAAVKAAGQIESERDVSAHTVAVYVEMDRDFGRHYARRPGPGPARRARGTGDRYPHSGPVPRPYHGAHDIVDWSDTGVVPWYVPAGAEFDTEMARGYNPHRLPGPNDYGLVSVDELTDAEHEHLTAAYPEELEDWDLSPMGATIRAGGWADEDWSAAEPVGDPFVEAFIEAAGNPALRLFGSDGAPNVQRIRAWEDDYHAGMTRVRGADRHRSWEPKYVPEPVEGPTDGLTAGERALGPVPGDEAPVAPPPSSSATGGLPTTDDGRIDPEAWKQAWA